MNLDVAIRGMLETREALDSPEGLFTPTFISLKIQELAQYLGAIEIIIAEKEESLTINETARYKEYMSEGKKTSTAKDLARSDFIAEHAEVDKLKRYVSSGWRVISTSQSRIKHLVEESRNQI